MKVPNLSILFLILLMSFSVWAQDDREAGIALYNAGNYEKAIPILKRSMKSETDGIGSYYLGMAYMERDNPKEASVAFEKAVKLQPSVPEYKAALAYAYLQLRDRRASDLAKDAIKLQPKNSNAHLVLASYYLYLGSYEASYEAASKAIEVNPKLAIAYRVRSEALIASFMLMSGAIIRPKNAKNDLLVEATENMQKYVELAPPDGDSNFYREYLESLKAFSDHYQKGANSAPASLSDKAAPTISTPYKVTYQPKAAYTDKARDARISGSIRLLIWLEPNGKVGNILILKPLGYGLDQQAVKAARSIRFEPATENGKPVSSVITREYTFTIF